MTKAAGGTATGSTGSCAAAATRSRPAARRSCATSSPNASWASPSPPGRPNECDIHSGFWGVSPPTSKRELTVDMDFAFSEEQQLLRAAARDYLTDRYPVERVVELVEGDAGWD